jgi:predicted Rossmann fold flavoprotein
MKENPESLQKTVLVIGGGAAGLIAAGRAASLGAHVILLEKNPVLGKKLLISGGGRCNFTNAEFDTRALLAKYGDAEKFLYSPFSQFGVAETFQFFESRGMATKIEDGKRAFPKSDSARSVLAALLSDLHDHHVDVRLNAEVARLGKDEYGFYVLLSGGEMVNAESIIFSTGGHSHPETGSTGDGFRILSELGVPLSDLRSQLVPICTKEKWGHALSGLSFADASVTLSVDAHATRKQRGKILFTHNGLSGPLILNMSKDIGDALVEGTVTLSIDIFPSEDQGTCDKRLHALLLSNLNKQIKNVLKEFLPSSLVPILLAELGIDGEREANAIRREERAAIIVRLKSLTLTPTALMGSDKAVITSGGVNLSDIDMRTMELCAHRGIYVVGDLLNIDRPSGGYSLQLCWTTGWVAGTHSAQSKK